MRFSSLESVTPFLYNWYILLVSGGLIIAKKYRFYLQNVWRKRLICNSAVQSFRFKLCISCCIWSFSLRFSSLESVTPSLYNWYINLISGVLIIAKKYRFSLRIMCWERLICRPAVQFFRLKVFFYLLLYLVFIFAVFFWQSLESVNCSPSEVYFLFLHLFFIVKKIQWQMGELSLVSATLPLLKIFMNFFLWIKTVYTLTCIPSLCGIPLQIQGLFLVSYLEMK